MLHVAHPQPSMMSPSIKGQPYAVCVFAVPYLPGVGACPVAFSPKQAERRCKRYANSDIVIFVSHGGTIGDLLYSALNEGQLRPIKQEEALTTPSYEGAQNTSVSSLVLPSPGYPFGPNGRTSGAKEGYKIRLEFSNNVVHLGEQRLRDWATEVGVAAFPARARL